MWRDLQLNASSDPDGSEKDLHRALKELSNGVDSNAQISADYFEYFN
jgi:hypothetical protein